MVCRLICLLLILSGCSYRWAADEGRTMSIPFVQGDEDGTLTAELIRSFDSAGPVRVGSDGRYRLDVAIVREQVDSLGFRRDPQEIRGKIHKDLVQNEVRKTMTVEVALFENGKKDPILGPFLLSSYVDMDYVDGDSLPDLQFQNAKGVKTTVLPFSLGQLESQESAIEAAQRPLYKSLSQKIVDVISSQW